MKMAYGSMLKKAVQEQLRAEMILENHQKSFALMMTVILGGKHVVNGNGLGGLTNVFQNQVVGVY